MKSLSMCIMSKDDEECLIENINYHALLGVEHFYIYDNNSQVPLKETLKDFKNVTVELFDDTHISKGAYPKCQHKCFIDHKDEYEWIAFVCTDEFIVLKNGCLSLVDFLKDYNSFGGLGINWRCFGSSGHQKKQTSVIKSFTTYKSNNPSNRHIKTIVNTKYCVGKRFPANCHSFAYTPGKYCVNENFSKITSMHANSWNDPPTLQKIQINHYCVRSREDYRLKQEKRLKGGPFKKEILEEDYWQSHHGDDDKQDTAILDLIKKINGN